MDSAAPKSTPRLPIKLGRVDDGSVSADRTKTLLSETTGTLVWWCRDFADVAKVDTERAVTDAILDSDIVLVKKKRVNWVNVELGNEFYVAGFGRISYRNKKVGILHSRFYACLALN